MPFPVDCVILRSMEMDLARIGRQVAHAPCVDLSGVVAEFSSCRTWRYTLSLPFRGRTGPHATIILKNPSSADQGRADKTVRTATEFVFRHFPDISGLHVLNLFAFRGTDAAEVGQIAATEGLERVTGPENDACIRTALERMGPVLVAWGGPSGIPQTLYLRRVNTVMGMLACHPGPVYRNGRRGSDRHPFHACYWGYDDPLVAVHCREKG